MKILRLCAVALVLSVTTMFPQTPPMSTPPSSPKIIHAFSHFRLRVSPTPEYDQAVENLMIAEADRIASDLDLAEALPITRTNVVSIYLDTPAAFIHGLELGSLETSNYDYSFSAGTTVSGVVYKQETAMWNQLKAKYTWPISRLDTNTALAVADQIMATAGANVAALNQDCAVDIRASMIEGPHGSHFMPFYWVQWNVTGTNVLFDDLPDQTGATTKREMWPLQSPSGKMMAALLQFLEPTRQIGNLQIFDPKYIGKKPLATLNLLKLLTPGNSRKTVLYEMKLATNAATRRKLYIKLGAPKSLLKELNIETKNDAGRTSVAPVRK